MQTSVWLLRVGDKNYEVGQPSALSLDESESKGKWTSLAETPVLRLQKGEGVVGAPFRVVTTEGSFVVSQSFSEEDAGRDFVLLCRLQQKNGWDGREVRRFVMRELDLWPCVVFIHSVPFPSKSRHPENWRPVSYAYGRESSSNGIFQIQEHKAQGLQPLRRVLVKMRGDSNSDPFRIVLRSRPDAPVLATGVDIEDMFDVFSFFRAKVGCFEGQTQEDWDEQGRKIVAGLSSLLSSIQVKFGGPKAKPLQLRGMSDADLSALADKIQRARTATNVSQDDEELVKVAPLVLNELAGREYSSLEARWRRIEAETFSVHVLLDGKPLGDVEVFPTWTLDQFLEQVRVQFPGVLPPTAGPDDTQRRGGWNLVPDQTIRLASVSAAVLVAKHPNAVDVFAPRASANSDGSVPDRPTFVSPQGSRKSSVSSSTVVSTPPPSLPVPTVTPVAPSPSGEGFLVGATVAVAAAAATSDANAAAAPPPPPPPFAPQPPPAPGPATGGVMSAAAKGPPVLGRPPIALRRLPGALIAVDATNTIWYQNKAEIKPLHLSVPDWKFGLDASRKERTVISHIGTTPSVVVAQVDEERCVSLLGVGREKNIAISLKGLMVQGIQDYEALIKWVCSGRYPDEDIKCLLADLFDQLMTLTPTPAEEELIRATVPSADEVKPEKFMRSLIAAGSDNWTRGLYTLSLWRDGSDQLRQVEGALIHLQQAIRVLEGADFFALVAPVASLVLTVEGAPSWNINFPAAVRMLLDKRSVGVIDGHKVSLLQWMFSLSLFPEVALARLDETSQLHIKEAITATDELGTLDPIEQKLELAFKEDETMVAMRKQVIELKKLKQTVSGNLTKLLLKFDPRPGKLSAHDLFESAAQFLKALHDLKHGSAKK